MRGFFSFSGGEPKKKEALPAILVRQQKISLFLGVSVSLWLIFFLLFF
jgi:hypothetical protein